VGIRPRRSRSVALVAKSTSLAPGELARPFMSRGCRRRPRRGCLCPIPAALTSDRDATVVTASRGLRQSSLTAAVRKAEAHVPAPGRREQTGGCSLRRFASSPGAAWAARGARPLNRQPSSWPSAGRGLRRTASPAFVFPRDRPGFPLADSAPVRFQQSRDIGRGGCPVTDGAVRHWRDDRRRSSEPAAISVSRLSSQSRATRQRRPVGRWHPV